MNGFLLSSIFAYILDLLICVLVLWHGHKKAANVIFSGFVFCLSFWTLGDFFFYFLPSQSPGHLLWGVKIAHIGALLTPAFYTHFVIALTGFTISTYAIVFLYLFSFTMVFINIYTPLVIQGVSLNQQTLELTINSGPLYTVFLIQIVILLIFCYYRLIRTYKDSHGLVKEQMQYFFVATIFILGCVVFYFPAMLGLFDIRLDNLCVVTYFSIIAYAITKHDLMDIRVIITKTTANVIAILIVLTTSFSIFFLTENKTTLFILSAITLIFWSLKFQDFRLFLQTTLEKKFLENRYNYAVVIQRFVDGFGQCSEIGDVAQVLKSTFNDEMEIADVRVYFPEFYEMTFRTSGTFSELITDADQTTHPPLASDTNWIQALVEQKTVLISSEFDALTDFGLAAALPCFVEGNLVCLVLLGKKLSEDGFKPEDVSLFSTIASQIPAVLDRIHRSRASVELNLAQRIQTEILPKTPEIPGLELACYMKPADEVGGDYYDVVVAGEYSWVLLGDVTGHGLGSGLVMFMAQSILTSILQTRDAIEPANLNYLANQILYKNLQRLDEQLPMTFVSLRFHEGRSFTVSGCHDNFLIYRATSQSIEMLSLDHFALGIGFSDSFVREDYTQSAYTLAVGDVIFMVTDGITEAFFGGNVTLEQYGEERLKGLFLKHAAGSAEDVKVALIAELDEFTGGIYHDDVTFIVAKAV
ncbi:MAG: hypothetical protein EXS67_00425 [Candidatus Margulisbacteria bacterium]|nr:hypothetical protein [Candidatus Margulisiibacteriota bacterium]